MLGTEIAALLSLCRVGVQAKPGSTQPGEQGPAERIQHTHKTPAHSKAIVGSLQDQREWGQ